MTLGGALTAKFGVDTGPLKKGLRSAKSQVGSFGRGLKGLISNPFVKLVAGVLAFKAAMSGFDGLTKATRNSENLRASLKILLRSGAEADKVIKTAFDFSDVTPFEPEPVARAAKQFLVAGFHASQLKDLLRDAGDLATQAEVPIRDVARAFARIKAGDFGEAIERLRDFGISKPELMAEGLEFSKGNQYLGDAEQAMAAIQAIIKRRFGGAMAEGAKTFDGLMSTLKGRFTAVFREIGTPITDFLKPALKDIIEIMNVIVPKIKYLGTAFSESIKSGNFGNLLQQIFKAAAETGLRAFRGMLAAVKDAIGQAFSMLTTGELWSAMANAFIGEANRMAANFVQLMEEPIRNISALLVHQIEKAREAISNLNPFGEKYTAKSFEQINKEMAGDNPLKDLLKDLRTTQEHYQDKARKDWDRALKSAGVSLESMVEKFQEEMGEAGPEARKLSDMLAELNFAAKQRKKEEAREEEAKLAKQQQVEAPQLRILRQGSEEWWKARGFRTASATRLGPRVPGLHIGGDPRAEADKLKEEKTQTEEQKRHAEVLEKAESTNKNLGDIHGVLKRIEESWK